MKSENCEKEDPRALREVQEWKTSVWEEVKELPFSEAVRSIAERAHKTAVELGFYTIESPARPLLVAEEGEGYVTKGDL